MLMNGPSSSNLDITDGVLNQFIFAYGQDNTFGYHQGRGSFSMDLLAPTKVPTARPTTPRPSRKPTARPTTPRPASRKPTRKLV